jgi:hypothetical protein
LTGGGYGEGGRRRLGLAVAVLRRPRLWGPAWRMVPPGWWRRWPPLPFPPAGYRRFRMETMYGDQPALGAEDLVQYLEWCRRMSPPAR